MCEGNTDFQAVSSFIAPLQCDRLGARGGVLLAGCFEELLRNTCVAFRGVAGLCWDVNLNHPARTFPSSVRGSGGAVTATMRSVTHRRGEL